MNKIKDKLNNDSKKLYIGMSTCTVFFTFTDYFTIYCTIIYPIYYRVLFYLPFESEFNVCCGHGAGLGGKGGLKSLKELDKACLFFSIKQETANLFG